MRKVRLHGKLGELFGKEFNLDVKSVGEAMRALKANHKGLFDYLLEADRKGIKYRVIIGSEDHTCDEDLVINHGDYKDFDIVPVPESQKAGARIIAGIVLIIVGILLIPQTGGLSTTLGKLGFALISAGASLTIGGIAELILGTPNIRAGNLDEEEQKSGFSFNSQSNVVTQGGPIPVAYGEILIGSQLVNFYQVSADYGSTPSLDLSLLSYNGEYDADVDPDEKFIGFNVGSTVPVKYQPTNPHVPLVTIVHTNDLPDLDIDVEFGISL